MIATATMSDVAGDPEVTEAGRLLAAVVLQDVTDTGSGPQIAEGVGPGPDRVAFGSGDASRPQVGFAALGWSQA